VTVLLSGRRGIEPSWLGFSWPRRRDGRQGTAQSLRIGVWALAALLAGGAITRALAMSNKLGQPAHQDISYLVYSLAASLAAGIVEETVVLGFVVTTLRQARRPTAEILYRGRAAILVSDTRRWRHRDRVGGHFVWLFLRREACCR
jgi:membrane protease YdiL (CAAX protease family)